MRFKLWRPSLRFYRAEWSVSKPFVHVFRCRASGYRDPTQDITDHAFRWSLLRATGQLMIFWGFFFAHDMSTLVHSWRSPVFVTFGYFYNVNLCFHQDANQNKYCIVIRLGIDQIHVVTSISVIYHEENIAFSIIKRYSTSIVIREESIVHIQMLWREHSNNNIKRVMHALLWREHCVIIHQESIRPILWREHCI